MNRLQVSTVKITLSFFLSNLVEGKEKCLAKRYGCQHYCVNLSDGGHRCMCHHGYVLASNGRLCEGNYN